MSRSASAAPRSPATVEKRMKMSVFLPTSENSAARVYLLMSWVTVKVPKAPEPLACMRRSGITSRAKWASFSRCQTSCSRTGPCGPAVWVFWLSTTGAPASVVSFFMKLPSADLEMNGNFQHNDYIALAQPSLVREPDTQKQKRPTDEAGRSMLQHYG